MNASSRGGAEVYFAVMHFTAGQGTASSTAAYMHRVGNSAHAIVDRRGDREWPVPVELAAWHAGDHTKDWRGGWRFPTAKQLEADFVSIADVRYQRGYVNAHSDGCEIVNLGYRPGGDGPYVEARHRNPGVRSKQWQVYTDEQIASVISELLCWRQLQPTLRFICGHEDVTNRHTLGRVGGKVDPGPAFPWDQVVKATGLVRVAFRFSATNPGWVVMR